MGALIDDDDDEKRVVHVVSLREYREMIFCLLPIVTGLTHASGLLFFTATAARWRSQIISLIYCRQHRYI